MSTATWIRDELEQQGVSYQEMHHPEAFTAQAVAQREHVSGHHVAKVVIVMVNDRPIELILPASRRVVLDELRDLLGTAEVRLATEDEMDRCFTDCERAPSRRCATGRGWKCGWTRLRTNGDIVFQGGTHSDAVRLCFDDWFRMVRPRVERFSAPANDRSGWGEGFGDRGWEL